VPDLEEHKTPAKGSAAKNAQKGDEEVKGEDELKSSTTAAEKDVKNPPSEIKDSYITDSSAKKRPNIIGIQGFTGSDQ
jgi:hypothetical protein